MLKEVVQTEGNWYQIEIWIYGKEWRALSLRNEKENYMGKYTILSYYLNLFKR